MGGGLIHGMMHRLAGDTKSVTMIPRARKPLDSERLGMTNGAILSMLKSKAAMERPNSLMSGIIPIGSRGLRGALYFVLFAFVTSRQRVSSSGFALAGNARVYTRVLFAVVTSRQSVSSSGFALAGNARVYTRVLFAVVTSRQSVSSSGFALAGNARVYTTIPGSLGILA